MKKRLIEINLARPNKEIIKNPISEIAWYATEQAEGIIINKTKIDNEEIKKISEGISSLIDVHLPGKTTDEKNDVIASYIKFIEDTKIDTKIDTDKIKHNYEEYLNFKIGITNKITELLKSKLLTKKDDNNDKLITELKALIGEIILYPNDISDADLQKKLLDVIKKVKKIKKSKLDTLINYCIEEIKYIKKNSSFIDSDNEMLANDEYLKIVEHDIPVLVDGIKKILNSKHKKKKNN